MKASAKRAGGPGRRAPLRAGFAHHVKDVSVVNTLRLGGPESSLNQASVSSGLVTSAGRPESLDADGLLGNLERREQGGDVLHETR